MTAYSLVANYFTAEDIICPFLSYSQEFSLDYNSARFAEHCRVRNISDPTIKMQEFAAWRICDGNGTIGRDRSSNHVLEVHQRTQHFQNYRLHFDGQCYWQSLPHEDELTKLLREEEAITITGSGRHAVLIYHDGSSLKVRNPNRRGSIPIDNFADILVKRIGNEVADSIAYRRLINVSPAGVAG